MPRFHFQLAFASRDKTLCERRQNLHRVFQSLLLGWQHCAEPVGRVTPANC